MTKWQPIKKTGTIFAIYTTRQLINHKKIKTNEKMKKNKWDAKVVFKLNDLNYAIPMKNAEVANDYAKLVSQKHRIKTEVHLTIKKNYDEQATIIGH